VAFFFFRIPFFFQPFSYPGGQPWLTPPTRHRVCDESLSFFHFLPSLTPFFLLLRRAIVSLFLDEATPWFCSFFSFSLIWTFGIPRATRPFLARALSFETERSLICACRFFGKHLREGSGWTLTMSSRSSLLPPLFFFSGFAILAISLVYLSLRKSSLTSFFGKGSSFRLFVLFFAGTKSELSLRSLCSS